MRTLQKQGRRPLDSAFAGSVEQRFPALTRSERAPSDHANTNGNDGVPSGRASIVAISLSQGPRSGPLIALFDSGTMVMADDPVVEAVVSSSPANPIASAIFDMGNLLGDRRLDDSTPLASFVATGTSGTEYNPSTDRRKQVSKVCASSPLRLSVPPENQ